MTGVQTCALPICFPVTIGRLEAELNSYVEAKYADIFEQLKAKKAIDKELEELLHKALSEFKATFAVK